MWSRTSLWKLEVQLERQTPKTRHASWRATRPPRRTTTKSREEMIPSTQGIVSGQTKKWKLVTDRRCNQSKGMAEGRWEQKASRRKKKDQQTWRCSAWLHKKNQTRSRNKKSGKQAFLPIWPPRSPRFIKRTTQWKSNGRKWKNNVSSFNLKLSC